MSIMWDIGDTSSSTDTTTTIAPINYVASVASVASDSVTSSNVVTAYTFVIKLDAAATVEQSIN